MKFRLCPNHPVCYTCPVRVVVFYENTLRAICDKRRLKEILESRKEFIPDGCPDRNHG